MSVDVIFDAIKEHNAKFIDLRFTDTRGKEQHITIPTSAVGEDFVENGKAIDGSSFKGWQKIHQSDLALVPDLESILPDPFYQDSTLFVRCNVVDPQTMMGYERCPRSVAQKAENYLKSTGIADEAFFGPEPEFFLFDDVRWETSISGAFYKIDSEEAHWNSGKVIEGGNIGHRPSVKGGYFPVPPVDSSHDIRAAICITLESLGFKVEAHHHEVATANQCEVATQFNSLTKKADELQILKYIVHNVAHNYGKTATFMPKPLVGDNGSGMHCHQSLMKDGVNLFSGEQYAGLSETALYYIGGIIKHARALNAFTNPSTNSYRRLVPGFEAPVLLAYSARNRSASIRIPHVSSPKARRIEVRFPDPTANPYLAFSAMMMAGLDGIQNKIHPGDSMDKDLYDLPPEALVDVPTVSASLEQAIEALKNDHEFLMYGDVFTKDYLNSYIELKETEITQIRSLTHPFEFELYYSL
ncbi:type I glutamate--ammonia ligase [Legionella israelensis]|uniref:Glutamine synthetase n=1 Tax=Legionella israelensis TaxID=454 RepID=A0A0W0VGZ8_9GAMM|nr:type I glutamate--ammonia ligase [Legionella israelensis]KTD19445.1 glutamine synthetase [Legionella israelensis]QBS08385.1 type I glutamate--ammonia ligase [Legionella israelensis]SCX92547.1 glutamine synthetase [Legionella israelensis DSM 19235]STX58018.1 glutamine synthetase [Legionella israelensis]